MLHLGERLQIAKRLSAVLREADADVARFSASVLAPPGVRPEVVAAPEGFRREVAEREE